MRVFVCRFTIQYSSFEIVCCVYSVHEFSRVLNVVIIIMRLTLIWITYVKYDKMTESAKLQPAGVTIVPNTYCYTNK